MSKVKCGKCGQILDSTARFCPNCGTAQEDTRLPALICEDCHGEIPNGSTFCPHCGCPVVAQEDVQAPVYHQESKTPEKNTAKKLPAILLLVCVILFLGAGGFYGFSRWQTHQEYQISYKQASNLYDAGQYESALSICESMPQNAEVVELTDKCRYQIGKSAMAAHAWEDAKVAFQSISAESYEDSLQLIQSCDEEIRRSNCADDAFLSDLEAVIASRLQKNLLVPDQAMAEADYTVLNKYKSAEFYDKRLGTLARIIVNNIGLQRAQPRSNANLNQVPIQISRSKIQQSWCKSNTNIAESLCELYDDYGFMKENDAFIEAYIEDRMNFLNMENAVIAIGNDIGSSLTENGSWKDAGNNIFSMVIHNDTVCNITVQFYFDNYSGDMKEFLFTGDYLAGNVPPKTDYSIYNSFQSFPSLTGTFSTMTDWEVVSLDYTSGGQLSLF